MTVKSERCQLCNLGFPFLGIHPRETFVYTHEGTHKWVLITVLPEIAKQKGKPKCSLIKKWIRYGILIEGIAV